MASTIYTRPVLRSDVNFRRRDVHQLYRIPSLVPRLLFGAGLGMRQLNSICYILIMYCCVVGLGIILLIMYSCGWSEAVFNGDMFTLSVQCVGCWWWLTTRSNSLFCGNADTMEKRSSAGKNREHYHAHWLANFHAGDLEPYPDHLATRLLFFAYTIPNLGVLASFPD